MKELSFRLLESGYCVHPEATSRAGASWRRCEFPALVGLLHHPDRGWILFDTGYGQAFVDATRRFPASLYRIVTPVTWIPRQAAAAQIQALGIGVADIGSVVISHFHGDHVGGLADFSAAQIWCSSIAWEDLHGSSRASALARGCLPELVPQQWRARCTFFEHARQVPLPADFAPFSAAYDVFGDESLLAVPLPGHAPGHYGVCFRTAGRWVFLIADAAWSIRAVQDNAPPPRWVTGALGNTHAYRSTLAALHSLASRRSGVTLVPAHCRSLRP